MPEELQSLLERIKKDGIEKAEAESASIIEEAKKKASKIVETAKAQAAEMKTSAEKESAVFLSRAQKSLQQAARDVVLTVGEALTGTLQEIVSAHTGQALSPDTLKNMLVKVTEAYCRNDNKSQRIEFLLTDEDKEEITRFFMEKYAEQLKQGVEIKAAGELTAGFRVSMVEDKVQHDFSEEAITEALCQLLRPNLAKIVREGLLNAKLG